MDSKIREALERAAGALYLFAYEPRVGSDRPQSYGEGIALESLKEINAILTAEPEPCEDALGLIKKIRAQTFDQDNYYFENDFSEEECAEMLSAFSSQVADKRAEELRAQVEKKSYTAIIKCKPVRVIDYSDIIEALAATEPKP